MQYLSRKETKLKVIRMFTHLLISLRERNMIANMYFPHEFFKKIESSFQVATQGQKCKNYAIEYRQNILQHSKYICCFYSKKIRLPFILDIYWISAKNKFYIYNLHSELFCMILLHKPYSFAISSFYDRENEQKIRCFTLKRKYIMM